MSGIPPVGSVTDHAEKPKKKMNRAKSVQNGLKRNRSNSSSDADIKVVYLNPLVSPRTENAESAPLSPRKRAGENAKDLSEFERRVSFIDVKRDTHSHKIRQHDTPPPWTEDALDKVKHEKKKKS